MDQTWKQFLTVWFKYKKILFVEKTASSHGCSSHLVIFMPCIKLPLWQNGTRFFIFRKRRVD